LVYENILLLFKTTVKFVLFTDMQNTPLHHLPMIINISLRQSKRTTIESLYEACADGYICTPKHLHTSKINQAALALAL